MSRRLLYSGLSVGMALLLLACDKTIHEYPHTTPIDTDETMVSIEVNVDRTPPSYYKHLTYDSYGQYEERLLEPELAEPYTPSERLQLRLIVELYRHSSAVERVASESLVERREVLVDRLKEAPQDTLQFWVEPGMYRVLSWADYVPIQNPSDWHFTTETLNAIRVKTDHMPKDNHHTSSGAGSCTFVVEASAEGAVSPRLLDQTRADDLLNPVIPVSLQRASGRFKLWANDLQDFLRSGHRVEDLSVQVIYKQYVSAGYNVDTGTPNYFVSTNTIETTPTTSMAISETGELLLAYDYVLTSSDKEDQVLIDLVLYEGDHELNHYQNITIPLQRNQETVVQGPFLTKKIGSGDIGIDDNFEGEIVVVVP